MHPYFLRHTQPIKKKKSHSYLSDISFLSQWLSFSSQGIISNTQGAISQLSAPILLFNHLCLYLLYIVFCVHTLITVISHNYVLCCGTEDCRLNAALVVYMRFEGLCDAIYSIFFVWQSLKQEQDISDINIKENLKNKTVFQAVIWIWSFLSIWSTLSCFNHLSWLRQNLYNPCEFFQYFRKVKMR